MPRAGRKDTIGSSTRTAKKRDFASPGVEGDKSGGPRAEEDDSGREDS